jgi:hypothetical protein
MIASDSVYTDTLYFLYVGFKVDEPRQEDTFDGQLDALAENQVDSEGLDQPSDRYLMLLSGGLKEVRR